VSGQRAKRKQRRRARARAAPAASARPRETPAAGRAQETPATGRARETPAAGRARDAGERAAPRHPSRLEVRDGVRRPDAVWAPFPLTEIGMAVGLVLFFIGFTSGGAHGAWLLSIGVVVLVVVVAELCLREHFAGFRSHSLLLGLLPVTIVHMSVVLLVSSAWRGPLVLVVDLTLAGGLTWWLHGRFRLAQERARRHPAV
jgi:hypothetical protein